MRCFTLLDPTFERCAPDPVKPSGLYRRQRRDIRNFAVYEIQNVSL
jgi:hypothetical protein